MELETENQMKPALLLGETILGVVVFLGILSQQPSREYQASAPTVKQDQPKVSQSKPAQSKRPAPPVDSEVLTGTTETIYRLPSVYRHKYVMLYSDSWHQKWAMGYQRSASQLEQDSLAKKSPDCDVYLALARSWRMSVRCRSGPSEAIWGVAYADLLCYVEDACFGEGFLLTYCRRIAVPFDVQVYRDSLKHPELNYAGDPTY